jgi:aminoglycoside phosphotransferase (APT) family kinase protein
MDDGPGTGLRDRLAAAVADTYGDAGRIVDLVVLAGGRSGETHRLTIDTGRGPFDLVVKVAPAGLAPVRNRDVLRQARLLRALAPVDGVAVPAVAFEDPGAPPGVPPLFAMQYVEGESFEPVSDRDVSLPAPATMKARATAAAAMLARLHTTDPALVAPGEVAGTPLDEVARWAAAFATVDEALAPGHRACAARLRASAPTARPPAIVHGDWRLGNMLCAGDGIAAVIDWELWSVADPRLDVAWFLAVTVTEGNPIALRSVPGLPSAPELLRAYETAAGTEVTDLDWFTALIRFKGAATMALNVKNNRKRPRPDPELEGRAARVPILLHQAATLLG